jgi:hypothetical protein
MPQDFLAEDLTSDPEYYDNINVIDPDYGEAEIMPEKGDNHLSAKLMLPKDGVMVKACVTMQKRDQDGNPIEFAYDNTTLDRQPYTATELTANMIANSLYSQCDPDSNQYALLKEIVDRQRLPTAVKLPDQKFVCMP